MGGFFQKNRLKMSQSTIVPVLVLSLALLSSTRGERILFFFGMSSYSHRISVWPLVEELASRGHDVVFLSPFPPKNPKPNHRVTELLPKELVDYMNGTMGNILERKMQNSHLEIWHELREKGVKVCEAVFANRNAREFLVKSENSTFDLVIIDALHNECGIGLAYKYKAPFIIYGASSVYLWHYDMYGIPAETSWIPDLTKDYPLEMTFLQRICNTLTPLYWYFVRHWFDFGSLDTILKIALELPHLPPMKELEMNVSLVLQNNHFSTEFPRSLPPLYVSVAGMHAQNMDSDLGQNNAQKLSDELEEFIAESEEIGFIYISFGTAIQVSLMEKRVRDIFFNTLKRFRRVRFIWKWEGGRPDKMPPNILSLDWAPQQEILMHPNIRGFITNGGLLSIQEAITAAVPLIIIPIFAEQYYNAEKVERQGYGIRLEIVGLEESLLHSAISNILYEPKYKDRMVEMSKIFKDRPKKPLETAVWWTEYILRNKGGHLLRPPSTSLTWYERRLLDVWIFVIVTLMCFFVIIFILIREILVFHFKKKRGPCPYEHNTQEQAPKTKPSKGNNAQTNANSSTKSKSSNENKPKKS